MSIAALVVLTILAIVVSSENAVTRADADVVSWVAGARTPLIVDVAHGLSWLGSTLVLIPLAIVAAAASAARRGRHALTFLPPLALAAAAIVGPLAKLVVGRPRPPLELAEVVERATGFPSGHSAQSAAFWVGLAMLVAAEGRHTRAWLVAGAVMALLIGLSRIVLGVHSPTDVLGGWSLGLACVLLSRAALQQRSSRDARDGTGRPEPVTGSGRG